MNYPDHNSLWRFWRDNRQALKEVFRQTVEVAVRSDLVGMALHALDGTKITSRGSTHATWSRTRLKRKLAQLDVYLEGAMREVETAEEQDSGAYRLPEELADKVKLRERIREKLAELEKENREHLNPADPQAQMMRNQEGTRPAYNAQAVVEAQSGIIVAPDVSTDPNDRFRLVRMLQQV
jgi:hypothetical protein